MKEENRSIFLRQVSGLVKSAGIFDVFIYNVGLISIGIGVAYTHLFGPANYPGGSIPIASLIATGVMILVGMSMWFWTVTLPRSGGLYVFVSRGLSPSLGFAVSFVDSCCWLFFNAVGAVLISTAGIAPMFSIIGKITGNSTFLDWAVKIETPIGQFIMASILIIASGLILISGMRKYFTIQKIMFAIALIGTILLLIVLTYYTRENFISNFDSWLPQLHGDAYDKVIEAAKSDGWNSTSFDWWETIKLSVWPFLPLIGGAFSIAIGGEIREVKKGQAIGILGSIISCGLLFAVIGWLSYMAIGFEFQGAITFNATHNVAMATQTKPFFTLLVAILTNNVWITAVICISFIAWIYFWIPGMLALVERYMLAMSFDRVAPSAFGQVSDKYHTPVTSIIITMIVSLIFTYLYIYTSFFSTLTYILADAIAWLITVAVGIIFPYVRKEMFRRSPVSRYKFIGIPLMSIVSFMASIALLFMVYLLWNDSVAAGHDLKSMITVFGTFGLGFLLFYAMRWYRKRQGINVDLAFKEIPIE